jgi:hypothetical protein
MLINNKEYTGVLFVHIPKTAGSSISKILYDNNLDNWNRAWPRHHDPYSYLKRANTIDQSIFSFSVVRNPYTRTYSCYKQYNKVNKTEISFKDYLENILKNIISPTTPLLHYPQSFYVTENNEIQVNKIYRFEDLKELESDFNWKLGRYNLGNYGIESYLNDYTNDIIDIVKTLYKVDFDLFKYSTNFDDWMRP